MALLYGGLGDYTHTYTHTYIYAFTFFWVVLRRVVSLQPLIQYVKHLPAEINENQGESPHRHGAESGLTPRDHGKHRQEADEPLAHQEALLSFQRL